VRILPQQTVVFVAKAGIRSPLRRSLLLSEASETSSWIFHEIGSRADEFEKGVSMTKVALEVGLERGRLALDCSDSCKNKITIGVWANRGRDVASHGIEQTILISRDLTRPQRQEARRYEEFDGHGAEHWQTDNSCAWPH
jgi:hypothetical protein